MSEYTLPTIPIKNNFTLLRICLYWDRLKSVMNNLIIPAFLCLILLRFFFFDVHFVGSKSNLPDYFRNVGRNSSHLPLTCLQKRLFIRNVFSALSSNNALYTSEILYFMLDTGICRCNGTCFFVCLFA